MKRIFQLAIVILVLMLSGKIGCYNVEADEIGDNYKIDQIDFGSKEAPDQIPQPESTPEPQPAPQPESTPEPQPAPQPESTPEPQPAPQPESTPEPQPVPQPESTPEPQPALQPESTEQQPAMISEPITATQKIESKQILVVDKVLDSSYKTVKQVKKMNLKSRKTSNKDSNNNNNKVTKKNTIKMGPKRIISKEAHKMDFSKLLWTLLILLFPFGLVLLAKKAESKYVVGKKFSTKKNFSLGYVEKVSFEHIEKAVEYMLNLEKNNMVSINDKMFFVVRRKEYKKFLKLFKKAKVEEYENLFKTFIENTIVCYMNADGSDFYINNANKREYKIINNVFK